MRFTRIKYRAIDPDAPNTNHASHTCWTFLKLPPFRRRSHVNEQSYCVSHLNLSETIPGSMRLPIQTFPLNHSLMFTKSTLYNIYPSECANQWPFALLRT